ncbi:MAG: hypothetical protein R6U11_02355 [Bacteroidales bacterium]
MHILLKHIKYVAIAAMFVIINCNNITNGQTAELSLSKDSILIGEQTELTIKVRCSNDANAIISWNNIYDTISKHFEIIKQHNIDTLAFPDSNQKEISQKLLITAWEEDIYVIYPFEFGCEIDGNTEKFESEAVLLTVSEVEIDEKLPPKDIKPILSVPITLRELLPWIIGALIIIIAAWLLYKYRRIFKKKKASSSFDIKPDIPAHIFALEELEKLNKKKLWQNGEIKLFHIELSNIIRYYIELRYGIMAMEMTTEEILASIRHIIDKKSEQYKNLKEILTMADLVKFARHIPLADENQRNLDKSFDFVYYTMEKEQNSENITDK